MDDLCDQMNNSQVWDPEENYDLFIYDYHDYERFILSGMDFDDTHEKVMRATSYVRLFFRVFMRWTCLPYAFFLQRQHVKLLPQMKEILERALASVSDKLQFAVYMHSLSTGILHYLSNSSSNN